LGGAQARPVIAEIIDVGAEQDRPRAELAGERPGDLEELGLAHVAAVGRVLLEPFARELVRLDDDVASAEAELGAEPHRVLALRARHRLRDRGDRVAALAEDVGGDGEEERRVDAAREADQRRFVPLHDRAQALELRVHPVHCMRAGAVTLRRASASPRWGGPRPPGGWTPRAGAPPRVGGRAPWSPGGTPGATCRAGGACRAPRRRRGGARTWARDG